MLCREVETTVLLRDMRELRSMTLHMQIVYQGAHCGRRFHQGEIGHPHHADIHGTKQELCGTPLLGAGVLRLDGWER